MINWKQQHCGVIEATYRQLIQHMPDVANIVNDTFTYNPNEFWWDVRVSMLMPGQYPAIPNWHFDHIPRKGSDPTCPERDWSKVRNELPMYLWLSGPPFTEFKDGRKILPKTWHKFHQMDSHRAVASTEHCWRGFIRAVHKDIHSRSDAPVLRRHSQVYLDSSKFSW